MRAIAVTLVLAAHAGAWEPWRGDPVFEKFVYPLVLGENGVLIFFTLSGFLITHLLLREHRRTGRINYRYFLARRALRLLPAFAIFWLILLALTLGGYYDIPPASFAFAAAYLYNFIPKHYYSGYFGLTWSLGVEEQFYLLWPLVLRLRKAPDLRPLIYWTTAVFIAGSVVFMAWVPDLSLPAYEVSADGKTLNLADFSVGRVFFPYRWFIPMGSYLLLGCSAAALVNGPNWRRRWKSFSMVHLAGLAGMLIFSPLYIDFLPYFPLKLLLTTGITFLLIYLYAEQQGRWVRVLEWAPLRHLGKLSYGLYLYSGIFLATGIAEPDYWWQTLPLALVLTYLLALASHLTVEKWFLQRKDRFREA